MCVLKRIKLCSSIPELIKESGNKQLQARSDKDENTPGHSVDNDRLKSSSNNSVSDTDKDHKASRLPVILPAVLTVIIFIVCVILIAFKSYNADEFLYQGYVQFILPMHVFSSRRNLDQAFVLKVSLFNMKIFAF